LFKIRSGNTPATFQIAVESIAEDRAQSAFCFF
jgi:hypothetical protein